mgnify:CR=1 FL=1
MNKIYILGMDARLLPIFPIQNYILCNNVYFPFEHLTVRFSRECCSRRLQAAVGRLRMQTRNPTFPCSASPSLPCPVLAQVLAVVEPPNGSV